MKTAVAPGKLILSGEHAVVYGAPALAMAVNRFAKAHVSSEFHSQVSFDLRNLKYHASMTVKALKELKHRLGESYEAFSRGEAGIRDVLKLPFELSQFALYHFFEKLNHRIPDGIKLTTESDIPMGCGMGSSGAMILCVMHAMALHQGLQLDAEHYYQHALEAENLQHGRSSGLDIRISLQGGCLYMHNGEISPRSIPKQAFYLVNTGKPTSTTGECVSLAKPFFDNTSLIEDFSGVTQAVDKALSENHYTDLTKALQENHRLLCHIGVVPQKVQNFIAALEKQACAAKICGAGSVSGDNGGMVLILCEEAPLALCQAYGYSLMPVEGEHHGLRCH